MNKVQSGSLSESFPLSPHNGRKTLSTLLLTNESESRRSTPSAWPKGTPTRCADETNPPWVPPLR